MSNLRPLDLIVVSDIRRIHGIFQKTTSFGVVAGGYLRDSYYRVDQKDIDVFVNSDVDQTKLTELLKDEGWVTDDEDVSEYNGGHISDILSFTKANQLPIQVIVSDSYKSIENVFATFDFGICQIAFNGSNVVVSDAFWNDAANNTVTLMPGKRPNTDHQKRLKAKYPSAKWVSQDPVLQA